MKNNGHIPLVGESAAMKELREEIERVARSDAKVLITGDSGVAHPLDPSDDPGWVACTDGCCTLGNGTADQ